MLCLVILDLSVFLFIPKTLAVLIWFPLKYFNVFNINGFSISCINFSYKFNSVFSSSIVSKNLSKKSLKKLDIPSDFF